MIRKGLAALAAAALLVAAGPQADWPATGRTFAEEHFSPLDQVTAANVGQLGLAWYADLETDRGQEATPLVVGRTLYNIEPWNIVTAYDAATGRKLWRYDPQVPLRFGRLACSDIVSRGLG